jgi:hypothetical protein
LKAHLLRLLATVIQPARKGWEPARHAATAFQRINWNDKSMVEVAWV